MNPSEYFVVYVTAPGSDAAALARGLVEGGHAACVNIVTPIRSVYLWEGRVCDEQEALLVIKTPAASFERLRQAVVDAHPYDVPEIIALPIQAGHQPYLDWIGQSTAKT